MQRVGQLLVALVDRLLVGFASGQPGFDVIAGRTQPMAHAAQVRTVRLTNLAYEVSELAPGLDHRKLVAQCVHFAFETIGRNPARQQTDFLGDFRRDVGIAVAVAAHPRTETQRCRVDGKRAPGQLEQRPIHVTQEARHGAPEDLLDDDESAAGLVGRRGGLVSHLIRFPNGVNFAAQALEQLFPLRYRQVAAVAIGEQVGDPIELQQQSASRHLGGACGQHQLNAQRAHRPVQLVGGHAVVEQAAKGRLARGALR